MFNNSFKLIKHFQIDCSNNILSRIILVSSESWENRDLYLRQKKSYFTIYPESLVGESSVANQLKASSHLIPLKWMFKLSGSHPVSCRESWVTNSSRQHAHQQVLDEAHAVAHIQQPCLQHAEWRHVSAEIKPQDLSKTAQELHDHKTVWETSSRQQQTRYPWQLW